MERPIVEIIKPTKNNSVSIDSTEKKLKRVAAYARVSTDQDEQLTSYGNQVEYYARYIQSRDDWEFVKVYSDEGISGLSTKKRDGFNQMMEDAINGKIDLILTKSISRFARNTVDSLTAIRKLKDHGVEVYFEKENTYTLGEKGEVFLTIMSTLAQEESRSISENVKWGKRRKMARGEYSMSYRRFLGYEKGPDGKPRINENQAKVVRHIYKQFLGGDTIHDIVCALNHDGIPTPTGQKLKWRASTVASILRNEKYKGDALLQKFYVEDYLTKRIKKNDGILNQYYIRNSHPAIISSEVFDRVQEEFARRRGLNYGRHSKSSFAGKVVCGVCGEKCHRRLWYSSAHSRIYAWSCSHENSTEKTNQVSSVREDDLQSAFQTALEQSLLTTTESAYSDISKFSNRLNSIIIYPGAGIRVCLKDGFETTVERQ